MCKRGCDGGLRAETSGRKISWNLDLNMIRVFISSVQKELAEERRAVKEFILHDPLLSRFIGDVFLFEDIPAGDRKPDDIYLVEVEQRDKSRIQIMGHMRHARWKTTHN